MRTAVAPLAIALAAAAAAGQQYPLDGEPGPDGLIVREGYRVQVAIADLPDARFLEFDDRGTLYVSRPQVGEITTFRDDDGDGRYERLNAFVEGRRTVHGMHFHDGWLWFTLSGSVHKARDVDGDGRADEVHDVLAGLPSGGHWWRSILVDGHGFYTSIGDSGNITDESGSDRQKIWRYALDGSERSLHASGIRNTEKLRLRPGTREIWGLDHGSDWFGRALGDRQGNQPITDLNPPDEFNRYVRNGFYGHPFVTGHRIPRYEFLDNPDIHGLASRTIPPEWCIPAHWAPNGFCFVDPARNTGPAALPDDQEGDAFIACHGSWNRARPAGYCIARILFDNGRPYGMLKIVDCLGENGRRPVARPVDCAQAPDGGILFSSDDPGRVYRITPAPRAPAPDEPARPEPTSP